ncbi:MAG: hypothetical protein IT445_11475 [Phycisphaeraceae bacterium]|nr:hypothetical protein [Phycisphaeraceae bacterium]
MTARLLHLIDAVHPAAPPTLAALIAAWPEAEHRALVRGIRGSAALAEQLQAVGLPHARWTSLSALRRFGWVPRSRVGRGDVPAHPHAGVAPDHRTSAVATDVLPDADHILAWSARSAAAAAIALPRAPLSWIAFESPGKWTAALLRRRGANALCFNDQLREQLSASGLKAQRVPALFDARWLSTADPGRWQRQADDRIIALLADDTRRCDVLAAVLAVSLLQESLNDQPDPPRLRLLVHPEAVHQARARRLIDEAEAPARLLVDPRMSRPWQLLASCDLALLWGERSELTAAWARAAGLPVLAAGDGDYRRAAENLRPLVNMGKTPLSQLPPTSADSAAWRDALAGT